MKVRTALSALVVLALAVAVVYWIARPGVSAADVAAVKAQAVANSNEPVPSPTPPHPAAVIPDPTFKFGMMRVNETRSHEFIVKNIGEALLRLGKPVTTCKCTVAKETASEGIPPGGEDVIRLDWTPKSVAQGFLQRAMIATNDPKMPQIELTVSGDVDELLRIEPAGSWQVGDVTGDHPAHVRGRIYSRLLDEFKVVSVGSENPLLTGEATPMTPEELKEAEAKSGYILQATLAPGVSVGKFDERLTVKTDIGDEEYAEMGFSILGIRRGPLQVVPLPGVAWTPEALAIDLGRFKASAGASASVLLFVSDMPEGETFRFLEVKSSEPYVALELTRDEEFKGTNRQKFRLTFRVPPGGPAATHLSKGSVKVNVTTNHPRAERVKFYVELVSTP